MFAQLPAARRLAVATLSEAGDAAAAFRGPDGLPLHGYVLMTGEGSDCRITIYIERGPGAQPAVLAGEMVWFQTPDPEPGPETSPETEPAREPVPVAAPEEAPAAEEPAEIGFKLYPEPATPVMATVPEAPPPAAAETAPQEPAAESEPFAVSLSSRHPLATRAAGTARLDQESGRLVLNVRGLPSPATLSRSANAYRAWLLNQRAGTRHPLGLLSRLWGENFRLESDPGLPLERFDAVLVTAEDRNAQGQSAAAPQVLLGTYTHP